MLTDSQTQSTEALIEYVLVNTNKPELRIRIAHGEYVPPEGCTVLFKKGWEQAFKDGNNYMLELLVVDEVIADEPKFMITIGGCDTYPDYRCLGVLETFIADSEIEHYSRTEELISPVVHLFSKLYTRLDHERPRSRSRDSNLGRGERPDSEIRKLIIGHLDDIIKQATLLKEVTSVEESNDAYARMRFAMSRIDRIEAGQYSNQRSRRRGRDVDVVYNLEDDSYYTPDGRFIETKEQRSARAWGERHERGGLARELTEEQDNAIHRREQFWEHRDRMEERQRRSRDD